jgi:hypothetical protein
MAGLSLFSVPLIVGVVLAQSPSGSAANTGAANTGAAPSNPRILPEREGLAEAQRIAAKAAEMGYTPTITPKEFGAIEITLTKTGKSEVSHGILGAKWDLRDTINLTYIPTERGLKVSGAKRTVEEKPPVGDWRPLSEKAEVPYELLAPLSAEKR